jgi:hypothetical protein
MTADETRAWLALTLNLAVLPGLGTLLQRKWIAGLVQLALAVAGAIGSIQWMTAFGREWARLGSFPIDRGPLFPAGLAGTIAFVTAWAWSAWSAWQDVRAAKT